MTFSQTKLRTYGVVFAIVLVMIGVSFYVFIRLNTAKEPLPKVDTRVTQRGGNIVKFKLGADFAASYGIEAVASKSVPWRPRFVRPSRCPVRDRPCR